MEKKIEEIIEDRIHEINDVILKAEASIEDAEANQDTRYLSRIVSDGELLLDELKNLKVKFQSLTTPSSLPTDEEISVFLNGYEKIHNPFFPNDRRWDKYEVFKVLQAFRTNFSPEKCEGSLLYDVKKIQALDERIRNILYAKLYNLYDLKLLNNGDLPQRKTAKDAVTIREFSSENNSVSVHYEIYWGGDVYDNETITLTTEEWLTINPPKQEQHG